ncbi:FHA domain-containing protein [Agromyces subbeticus]|uniref:FHA domain-containing protein n=1 Tax=Agromyces subbeticus TaxID=293890 RepID=UPI0003B738D0|nr:FHA domain-containing protein [Agromyces subbeticus]
MVAGVVSSSAEAGAPAWDVIVGDRFIVALSAPAPQRVLSALAEAATDTTLALEALVGLIPSGRIDPIDSFGVVWWSAESTSSVTAVVRGDAVVDLDSPGGSRRFDARGIRPWHLADFDDVVAVRLTDAAAALDRVELNGEQLAHPRASLRASAVEWAAGAPPQRAERPATEPAAEEWLDADTVLAPRLHHSELHEAVADTIVTPRPSRYAVSTPPPRPTSPMTTALPPAVADSDPSTPEPVGAPRPPDAPGSSVPVVGAATSGAPRFRIGRGAPVTVTVPVLIGRRPLPPRITVAGPSPQLITVASPGEIVSGTHLELRVVGTRLVATDLRSTNGTMLRTATGARRLRAGESIVVMPGSTLELGDDTIVEILSAQGSPSA